jgi:hypothetical protein
MEEKNKRAEFNGETILVVFRRTALMVKPSRRQQKPVSKQLKGQKQMV